MWKPGPPKHDGWYWAWNQKVLAVQPVEYYKDLNPERVKIFWSEPLEPPDDRAPYWSKKIPELPGHYWANSRSLARIWVIRFIGTGSESIDKVMREWQILYWPGPLWVPPSPPKNLKGNKNAE